MWLIAAELRQFSRKILYSLACAFAAEPKTLSQEQQTLQLLRAPHEPIEFFLKYPQMINSMGTMGFDHGSLGGASDEPPRMWIQPRTENVFPKNRSVWTCETPAVTCASRPLAKHLCDSVKANKLQELSRSNGSEWIWVSR